MPKGRKMGAGDPAGWQVGKTAASIEAVRLAEWYIKRTEKTIRALNKLIEDVKNGKTAFIRYPKKIQDLIPEEFVGKPVS